MSKKTDFFKTYMALVIGLSLSNVLGYAGEKFHESKVNGSIKTNSIVYENQGVIEIFEPGEHAVIEKVDSPLNEKKQYASHPGYKPVGIASSTYGRAELLDGGSCIMFVNDETVQASANGKIGEDYYFGEFGIPVDYTVIERENGEYQPGEHIISVPVANPTEYEFVYEYHEGYEPIGIATASHGNSLNIDSGAAVLYVNTKTVICENDKVDFGTPKEETKVKKIS